jgi:bifunctional enzyme CysN/CysC
MKVLQLLRENESKDLLRFVTAGSVDDGKSTLIGRLLHESKGIYEDQLQSLQKLAARGGGGNGEFDLALVTDGLKAEREQGITIDVAYRYFSTPRRKFIIADTPGHEQYTRNMATGASTASLIIILIDAEHGVITQSRRHTFIASLLGIPHVVVAVNKMDLVDYSQEVFEKIRRDFTDFAARLEVKDVSFIPVSALKGDNVVERSDRMPWYKGSSLLNHLETVHIASDRNLIDLRLPVQYVSRPDRTFRGYMGTVASGVVKPGDEVMVLPGGMRSRVERVLGADGDTDRGFPPLSVCVTLEDEIDISRGDMLVHVHNLPRVERTLDAMIVWMSEQPMDLSAQYYIKQTTSTVSAQISKLHYRVDVNTLHRSESDGLKLNEIGRAVLTLSRPLCFDPYNRNRSTGSFIIIDRVTNNTVGVGMILDREPNTLVPEPARRVEKARSTHVEAQSGRVSLDRRIERLGQKPATLWLSGLTGSGKTSIAHELERRLFEMGRHVTVLDGENLRLSLNKDLGFAADDRAENVRRAAELARLLNDNGQIALCSLLSPYRDDRQRAREIIGTDRFIEVYLSAPLEVCRQRRPEAYERAVSGEVREFSGVTAPYEAPSKPELTLATDQLAIDTCVDQLIKELSRRGFIW